MPQLDFLTYMTQIIWLFITLTFMYLFSLKYLLPHLKNIYTLRQIVQEGTQTIPQKDLTSSPSFPSYMTYIQTYQTWMKHQQDTLLEIKHHKEFYPANERYLTTLIKLQTHKHYVS